MYNLTYQWKPFRTHLPSLHALLQQNADVTKYCGMSADTKLTLHFNSDVVEVDAVIQKDIDDIWADLTEEGEAAKFKLDEDRANALASAKAGLLTADFSTLIPAERKIWMNAPLTNDDLDALIAKQKGA